MILAPHSSVELEKKDAYKMDYYNRLKTNLYNATSLQCACVEWKRIQWQ